MSVNHLGRFLRLRREQLGLTSRRVEELTRNRKGMVRISHSNLLAIESGKHIPTFDKILTLAQVLHAPVEELEEQLRSDMLPDAEVGDETSYDDVSSALAVALDEGRDRRALELAERRLRIAQASADGHHRCARLDSARLDAARCRIRAGLLTRAQGELERLVGSGGPSAAVTARGHAALADVHRLRGRPHLARLHAATARELAPDELSPTERAELDAAHATALAADGQLEAALAVHRSSVASLEAAEAPSAVIRARRQLAAALCQAALARDAIEQLDSALAEAESIGDLRSQSAILADLARAHLSLDSLTEARNHAKLAKDIAQRESHQDVLFASLYHLWNIARRDGQEQLTTAYHDRLHALAPLVEAQIPELDEWQADPVSAVSTSTPQPRRRTDRQR